MKIKEDGYALTEKEGQLLVLSYSDGCLTQLLQTVQEACKGEKLGLN